MINRGVFEAARVVSNALFGKCITDRSYVANRLYALASDINHVFHPGHRRWRRFMEETPFAPWWVPEAVAWLEKNIKPGMRAFEWGAGRSTVWISRHGVDITCAETDPHWARFVKNNSPAAHVILTKEKGAKYASLIDKGAPYDLIVVDGYYRDYCLPKAMQSVSPGGIIVVDNADDAIVNSIIRNWKGALAASFDNGVDRTNFYCFRHRRRKQL